MKTKRSKYKRVFEHLFSFQGYKLFDLKETKKDVFVILEKVGPYKCPVCGSDQTTIEETYTRVIRDLNLRQKTSNLQFEEKKSSVPVDIEELNTWILFDRIPVAVNHSKKRYPSVLL